MRTMEHNGEWMSGDKVGLRRHCCEIRDGFSSEKVQQSSCAVCDHLCDWEVFQRAETILAFLAFRNEIDLAPLFERWPGKRWLVPRIVGAAELGPGEKPFLRLHHYNPQRLVRHRYGMLEPHPELPSVAPQEIELVLVPGVAFDRHGGRLGYGGGFYDRLLPLMPHAVDVGVTYEEFVLDSVPMAPWDVHIAWLVTPSGMIKTGEAGDD
jgi:5-formyltetrahydrofolate cyclo-ligase